MDMEKVITSNETGLLKATSEILKIKSVKEAPSPICLSAKGQPRLWNMHLPLQIVSVLRQKFR